MNKRSTLYGLAVLLFSALTLNTVSAQVFWTETFASASSTNWVSAGTNPGAEVWTHTTDPLAGFMNPAISGFASPTVSDGYFYFNSDANGENNAHDVTLTGSSPANCSGKTGVRARFYSQYIEFNAPAAAYVGVSTDNGVTFTDYEVLANAMPDEIVNGSVVVALPAADNQAQVWLRFRWKGEWEYHWKVDDLELFTVSGPVPCDQNPMAIICDNLDNYVTTMTTGQQASWWTTWSGVVGTTEDGIVSTEQASTPPNSMKVISLTAGMGPQDVVLNLSNKSTGRYELKWKMYVPAGKNAYYNVQNVVPIGATGVWNLNVYFENNGGGRITGGGDEPLATFKFKYDTWVECRHIFDLDNNLATYYMADTFITKKAFTGNLGGIDFFGANAVSTFYLDDIEYIQLPPVTYNVDSCGTAVDLQAFFGQAPGVAQTTGLYNNTNATASPTDPVVTCWGEDVSGTTDVVNSSLWYTFIGDGNTYHIETVPCFATNYIGTAQADTGDTQMLIFAGEGCSGLTPIICNDDLSTTGDPDWRAGVDLETVNGQNYMMLIDGFQFNGVLATGEFCIEITQEPSVTCNDAKVGTYSLNNNGLLCWNQNLNTLINIDPASFVLPNLGPVYGMVWSITAAPVAANVWPGTIPGVSSTVVNPNVIVVSAPNNGTGFQPGQYYLTVSVVAGGSLINPASPARVFNVDPSGGCFFNGPSVLVTFLPNLAVVKATAAITQPTGGANGAINLTVTGGLADPPGDPSIMIYAWTGPGGFTATTRNISGLAAGSYTVVITDPSGCVAPFTATYVLMSSDVADPASVRLLQVSPNPTSSAVLLNMELAKAVDVRIEVLNTLGQVVQTIDAGKVSNLNRSIDLSSYANGTYVLRMTLDQEIALRRVVLQK